MQRKINRKLFYHTKMNRISKNNRSSSLIKDLKSGNVTSSEGEKEEQYKMRFIMLETNKLW